MSKKPTPAPKGAKKPAPPKGPPMKHPKDIAIVKNTLPATKTDADDGKLLGDEVEIVEVEAAPLPDAGDLMKVRKLAEFQVELTTRLAKGEALMKFLSLMLKDVTERQLPLAMKSIGMKDFTMMDDSVVEMDDFILAGIKKENTEKAHKWLEDHKQGDLIKHVLTISFGKGEDAWAKKFMADLAKRKRPLDVERKDSVHFQTLNAFIREEFGKLRAKGVDPYTEIPKDIFGIYEGSKAVFKPSKAAQKALNQAMEDVVKAEQAAIQRRSQIPAPKA